MSFITCFRLDIMVTVKLYEKTGTGRVDADCLTGRLTADGAELSFVFILAQLQSCSCVLANVVPLLSPVSSLVALIDVLLVILQL